MAERHRGSRSCSRTYNGGAFLGPQLQSLFAQTHINWRLVVSDDGSTDNTLDLVVYATFSFRNDQLSVVHGPRRARVPSDQPVDPRQPATLNFLALTRAPEVEGSYFAWCDQDDVWQPEKLERAVGWLDTVPSQVPALYCSRTQLISENGTPVGISPLFAKPPSFRNALVQSLAGGNTMVFNRAARDLIASAGEVDVVAHDWWAYLLVTGAGGVVNYDRDPTVQYRQHGQNLVGTNQGVPAVLRRMHMVLAGGFSQWMDLNLAALEANTHLLTAANRMVLREFCERRRSDLKSRIGCITSLGLYRQTARGQLALWLAATANRL